MLLRQIKSESYGVLRYKLFRPSLSAKRQQLFGCCFFCITSSSCSSVFLWFFFNLVEKQRLQKKFPFKQFQTVHAIHVPFDLSTK